VLLLAGGGGACHRQARDGGPQRIGGAAASRGALHPRQAGARRRCVGPRPRVPVLVLSLRRRCGCWRCRQCVPYGQAYEDGGACRVVALSYEDRTDWAVSHEVCRLKSMCALQCSRTGCV
jgi:hypothetical protein